MIQREAAGERSSASAASCGVRQRCRTPRSSGAICLVVVASVAAFGACDERAGENLYRARALPGVPGNENRDVRPGKGGDSWGGRTRWPEPDASARGARDAGSDDAGTALASDAGASLGTDAGAAAAGGSSDAGTSPVRALSDAQILRVADAMDALEIERAQALLPLLTRPELQSFAQDLLDQHQLARDSWNVLAGALHFLPEDSAVADEVQANAAATLQGLLGAGPEALPALYLDAELADHAGALELSGQLINAADAEALRAQLIVWRTIESDQRAAAEQLATELAASSGDGTPPAGDGAPPEPTDPPAEPESSVDAGD